MAWLKRYFVYTLLSLTSLLLLFVTRNVFIENQFIDEKAAVGIAKNYCDLPNLEQKEITHKFKVELLTCGDMNVQMMLNG